MNGSKSKTGDPFVPTQAWIPRVDLRNWKNRRPIGTKMTIQDQGNQAIQNNDLKPPSSSISAKDYTDN